MKEMENLPHMQLLRAINNNPAITQMQAIERVFPTTPILREFNSNPVFTHAFSLAEKLSVFESHFSYITPLSDVLKQYEGLDLDSLIEEYEAQVDKGPQNSLSLEFYLGMFLSLVMFVYSEYSSYLSEQELIEQLNGLENQVQLLTDKIEKSPINTFFIVEKSLKLRSGPSLESEVLDVLPEKLKLIGLETRGKWLKVEYFDYLSNTMESGWVHSDYLQVVILNGGA